MAIVLDKSHRWRVVLAHVLIIAFICLIMFPFLMIFSISIRPGNFASGSLIPQTISWEHWALAFGFSYQGPDGVLMEPQFPVLLWLWNSVKVALLSAFIGVVLSTTCAYAFARMRFMFKNSMMNALLLIQMFPSVLALVAIYTIFDRIGSYIPWLGIESHGGLILAYTGGIAVYIWTIRGYFETIPVEVEEAAKVDGATAFQAFRYVILPMIVPILMVVFLLAFIGGINEYPVASIMLKSTDNLTLAVGVKNYLYPQKYMWGDFAAAAILSGLPITVVFLLAQKWMISGLTAGSVKG
jgi:maltose/maltodextrin transport system permease protein